MDDPISALDANVRKKIFVNVFLKKFRNKTRVLVTHAVDFLHLVDSVIVMNKGETVLKGHYSEIKDEPYLKSIMGLHDVHQQAYSCGIQAEDDTSDNSSDSQLEVKEADEKPVKKDAAPAKADYSIKTDKEQLGKIMTDEDDEETDVEWSVYFKFVKRFGGPLKITISMILMFSFGLVDAYQDYLIGVISLAGDQRTNLASYSLTFFLCVFATTTLQGLRFFFVVYYCLKAAR